MAGGVRGPLRAGGWTRAPPGQAPLPEPSYYHAAKAWHALRESLHFFAPCPQLARMHTDAHTAWGRLKTWAEAKLPDAVPSLRGPATEADFENFLIWLDLSSNVPRSREHSPSLVDALPGLAQLRILSAIHNGRDVRVPSAWRCRTRRRCSTKWWTSLSPRPFRNSTPSHYLLLQAQARRAHARSRGGSSASGTSGCSAGSRLTTRASACGCSRSASAQRGRSTFAGRGCSPTSTSSSSAAPTICSDSWCSI